MATFRITLAYDGGAYVGWQRQASGTSVQGLLEDALRDLDGRDVAVTGAGRTDAGVHALGQVASFAIARTIAADALARALNARLPDSVRVVDAVEAAPAFHPRFDARSKTYRYRIWNGTVMDPFERAYAWHVIGALDVAAMDAAARRLEGRHDFAAFQATGSDTKTTVRVITSSRVVVTEGTTGGRLIAYEITGDGFLRHMVRAIAGTLVEIGHGRRPATAIVDVLASRDRGQAGPTAPACGLFLVSVDYGRPCG